MSATERTPGAASGTRRVGDDLLTASNVTHRWRPGQDPVLDDVTITMKAGQVTWIGGRNGVGKTTLLRVLAGILIPGSGDVRLDGLHPQHDRAAYAKSIGFLSAGDRGLHARMRVRQQLDYWARLAYIPREERAERVAVALDAFALDSKTEQRVDRLSQGWRQRVRLAMAFLHEPRVVLLDEPRNSLDDDGYAVLSAQVNGVAARGGAVLWCSPRGEDAVIEFDQCFSLHAGVLEAT